MGDEDSEDLAIRDEFLRVKATAEANLRRIKPKFLDAELKTEPADEAAAAERYRAAQSRAFFESPVVVENGVSYYRFELEDGTFTNVPLRVRWESEQ